MCYYRSEREKETLYVNTFDLNIDSESRSLVLNVLIAFEDFILGCFANKVFQKLNISSHVQKINSPSLREIGKWSV